MHQIIFILYFVIFIIPAALAQNASTPKGLYLGQHPPGKKPELFAPGIISTNYYEHSSPAFSPDGNTVLWTVIYAHGKPAQLLEMRQENGEWSQPASPSFADKNADEFYPAFSSDGKKLYFSSRRKVPDGYKDAGLRIWEVDKTSAGWGNPVPFDTTVSTGEDYAMSMSDDGTVYFAVRRQQGRVFDIVSSVKQNNRYQKPEMLPYNINTTGSEDGAFIAPDGSYLIFESARSGSIEGSTDLYISFRNKDGTWMPAKNMGPEINSKHTERFPRLSPNGKYLFFGSDRNESPGSLGTDVFWVDASVITNLKNKLASEKEVSIGKEGLTLLEALYHTNFNLTTALLKKWLDNHPQDMDAFVEFISILRRNKQSSVAWSEINAKGINLPSNIDMKLEVAMLMYEMNKSEEAEKYILSELYLLAQPRFRYIQLANQLYQVKKYPESAAIFEAALKIQAVGVDYYNMACCWSLVGNKDKAFDALNKAADIGYASRNNYEMDEDLASLKTDNRWVKLMQKLDAPFNGSTPYKRAHHEMVYDESSKSVILVGGSTPLDGGQSSKFFNDIWRFSNGGWDKIANAGDERSGIRIAYNTRQNKIYSFGGFIATNQSSGQLRVYENGKWKILSDVPDMKATESGFVYDKSRDKFIAFGGSAARGEINNITWEWDGISWKKFEGHSPDGRQAFAMVYDDKRNKTVLYGGVGDNRKTFTDGVWEFDGMAWKNTITANNPGERISPGYAFDSKRNLFILFGGISKNELMNDLWSWDGKEWKLLSTGGPSKRTMGYLAYDKERDKIVLFGGRLGWPNDAGDTWEWNGETWSEVK